MSFSRELPGGLERLLDSQAAFGELLDAQAIADDGAATETPPNALDDLARKRQAFLEAATVFVVSPIGERRHELLDQMALRAVDLDAVHAGLDAVHRAHDEGLDHLAHFARRERMRNAAAARTGNCRGSNRMGDDAR